MNTSTLVLVWLLCASLAGDALLSLRPPTFISDCLHGVGFPREWWWTLVVIKALAAIGLAVGALRNDPGVAATVAIGTTAYFGSAAITHIRARFTGSAFWINCLAMLLLSTLTAGVTVAAYL
ncbi:hypothetical protein DW322_13165 [Rhodococcus rhodnii]|uniref:Integral membrane protein n=2 Tax=Rhodococcus rhodnii TaxID=38312 RepID=R7WKK0_9NOCA|nr:DoxX family protein [Rhodococcus rhodnii]EOM75817.1 hypothetical protein Rrhod_2723 [Rhodococcus rhodnii LMG 5362]TXG91000.1 hypothetical protein DW322_13165 [Rhodococcus rhodnii]